MIIDDYFEPNRWFDEDGMPITPVGLGGVRRRFAMGEDRWKYYYALHKEKIAHGYDPYSYIEMDGYLS